MSYCRWSDMDYQCDVYAYETEGGYQIHVASKKRVFKEPLPEKVHFSDDKIEEWLVRWDVMQGILERSDLVDIGLPYDGESYCYEDQKEFLARLMVLREAGYRIPDWTFDEVMMEVADAEFQSKLED